MTEHTKLPWKVSDYGDIREATGKIVASADSPAYSLAEDAANAEFIVRAVNAHDKLIEVLEGIRGDITIAQLKVVDAALALARGESADHCLCEFATEWDGKTHDKRCHKAVTP